MVARPAGHAGGPRGHVLYPAADFLNRRMAIELIGEGVAEAREDVLGVVHATGTLKSAGGDGAEMRDRTGTAGDLGLDCKERAQIDAARDAVRH